MGVGDLLGRTVAQHQPATLAAIEGVAHTETGAGLNVGGIPLPGHATTVFNVKVPNLLSLLAYDRPNAPVRGLDTFPKADRTPLAAPTRLAFIGMAGIGTGLVILSIWYWLRRRRNVPGPRTATRCSRWRQRVPCRSYWYLLYPVHRAIFTAMLRKLRRAAGRSDASRHDRGHATHHLTISTYYEIS